jgi:predicted phosphodiesterase
VKRLSILLLSVIALAVFIGIGVAQDKIPFPFVVVGDTGCGCSGQKKVADRMMDWYGKHPFNTVLMLGDNIYGGGLFGGGGGSRELFPSRFDAYYKLLMDRGVKFYATLGNHDYEVNRGRDEIEDKQRFNILGDKGFYTFGPQEEVDGKPLIQFFALNSVRMLIKDQDPEQTTWLSKALTDSKAIWKIAYFHHPLYAPEGGHKEEKELRENVEKILIAAGVQVVFSGHNHYYARMKPQSGVTYIISGGGGKDLKTPRKTAATASTVSEYHFIYAEADKDKLVLTSISDRGSSLDQVTLNPVAVNVNVATQ